MFTATYNRRHLLPRLYDSLCRQTCRDFEWVVVDDGSDDDPGDMLRSWADETLFPIRYHRQPNSGWHVARDRGVAVANGFFFAVVDDDDWLLPEALKHCVEQWRSIPQDQRQNFSGVTGLCSDAAGRVVGSHFPQEVLDSNSLEVRARYRVKGDNWGPMRTEVAREFPYPTDLGRYVPRSLVYNRIAEKYQTRYFDRVLLVRDYQAEGISALRAKHRVLSPGGFVTYYAELAATKRPLPLTERLKAHSNFVRSSLHAGLGWSGQTRRIKSRLLWGLSVPGGTALYLRDRWRLRARQIETT